MTEDTELKEYYDGRRSRFAAAAKTIAGRIDVISNARLVVALVFLAVFYFAFKNHALFYTLPFILAIFVILVRKHASLFSKKLHLENLIRIQQDELKTLSGDYSFRSSGSEFIDPRHPYTHDLDIFGDGSLFQYMNRCHTSGGKKVLAGLLSLKPDSTEIIFRRQEAARELSAKTDFRHEINALAMEIGEQSDDERQLTQWLQHPSFVYGKAFYRVILSVFPVITTSLVLTAFFVDGVTPFAVLAAGFQWVFLGFHMKSINAFHQYISRKKSTLDKYARTLACIQGESFASADMRELADRSAHAAGKIQQLASLVSAFDARLNILTNIIINSLFLYDLQCVYRLERWKEDNADRLVSWLETIRQAEAFCSLGSFTYNHPGFAFPALNSEQSLTATALGHPLLDEDIRVANDVHLDSRQSIMIITGANMAGKSTFLRALGVNVVLAHAGAPVCATQFDCPLIALRSGMRTADSLKESQSYFFAELDRLKTIMEDLRAGIPLLILLDEILKGTNSTDKQAGSMALVRQLTAFPCLTIIATHDLALGELEDLYPGRISNYCFEAKIEDDQLDFDYKLKRGLAQTMNATFLMKKMGIIL